MSLTVAEAAPVISPVPALATGLDEDDDGDPRVPISVRAENKKVKTLKAAAKNASENIVNSKWCLQVNR
jgi:hypothetical protein